MVEYSTSLIPTFGVLSYPETVIAFALEPHGKKLAVIHGEPPARINVSLYQIGDKGTKIATISELVCCRGELLVNLFFPLSFSRPRPWCASEVFEKHPPVNHIFWSPQGQFVVLAGLKAYVVCYHGIIDVEGYL